MSEEPEFFTYTGEEFLDEFVHPDDRPRLEEARQKRALQVRAEYLTEMRKKAGLTQAEVAEAMGVSQQRWALDIRLPPSPDGVQALPAPRGLSVLAEPGSCRHQPGDSVGKGATVS